MENTETQPKNRAARGQLDTFVIQLDCSVRLKNICHNNRIETVEDMAEYMEFEFLQLHGCGRKVLNEARGILADAGCLFVPKTDMPIGITVCAVPPLPQRTIEIFKLVARGDILRVVGAKFNISSERVRQITHKVWSRFRRDKDIDFGGSLKEIRKNAELLIGKIGDVEG